MRLWVKDDAEKTAWVKEIHEAVQTKALKVLLEDNIKQNKLEKRKSLEERRRRTRKRKNTCTEGRDGEGREES